MEKLKKIEIDELENPETPLERVERMLPFVIACEEDGIGKTEGYRRIAAGEWTAYRDGPRKVLISARSILARRERFVRKITPGARKGLYKQPPNLRREATA
jgi:hypothetical protein